MLKLEPPLLLLPGLGRTRPRQNAVDEPLELLPVSDRAALFRDAAMSGSPSASASVSSWGDHYAARFARDTRKLPWFFSLSRSLPTVLLYILYLVKLPYCFCCYYQYHC